MVRNTDAIAALRDIAKSWGGSLEIVPEKQFLPFEALAFRDKDGWTHLPDPGHVLHYETKRIVVCSDHACAGNIIHEMGHAFADKAGPDSWTADEWQWFGWEVCLARKVDCYRRWSKSTNEYMIGSLEDEVTVTTVWKQLDYHERRRVAENRIAHAMAIGLVDADRMPKPIR